MSPRAPVLPDATVDLDSRSAVELVLKMMAIPGKSCEESRVVEFISQEVRRAGVPDSMILIDDVNRTSPAGGETGNLIVKLPGNRRGPRRLLMAHIDTVPLCVGSRPVLSGNTIRSRDPATALGGDNRAGASVLLHTLLAIVKHDLPHPPLTFFWPVQEEIGLLGARFVKLPKLGNPKLGFNWDGGAPHVACVGATGDYSLDIQIDGIASHAGVHPEQGVSAIAVAALAIADLQQNGWHGLVVKGRNAGSSNVGVIAGGDATNVVTPKLMLRAEVRSHDAKFRLKLVDEFRKAFDRAVKQVKAKSGKTGKIHFAAELKYESFRLADTEPCVVEALAAIESLGLKPETRISNGGLDANWLTSRGLPTVTLGCGQQEIHTVAETLDVESYVQACGIARRLAVAKGA
jgi:tripeptide aminopeptidase